MTYSEVVHLLSSHMVPKGGDGGQMIPLLEKFVNEQRDGEGSADEFAREGDEQRQEADFDRQEFPESQRDELETEQSVQDQSNAFQSNY